MRRMGMLMVLLGAVGVALDAQPHQAPGDLGPGDGRHEDRVHHGFGRARVEFTDCTEFAGLTAVPLANVRNRVPSQYLVAGEPDGLGVVVFRTASCDGVRVDGGRAEPGIVAQVGVNVVAPTGTGDINNYTLYFATDSFRLFLRLRLAGVNAMFVPELAYDYSPNPTGTGGMLLIDVPRPRRARYELGGIAFEPLASDPGFPFVANWWRSARHGDVVMETSIPNIRFGDGAGVTVTVDPRSDLAGLLGSTTASFPILAVRGVFAEATMEVRPEAF
jgi:hypothetical protein